MKYCLSISLILPLILHAKAPYIPYDKGFPAEPPPSTVAGLVYKSFYEAYHNQDLDEERYLIPPLIHFIWLGSPIPTRMVGMIESWRKLHPDWTIWIWTDEDVEPFGLQNKEAFDRSVNFGQKSDIFRYEILYRFGGVYVDSDFECLKPFDCLHKSCEFYAGIDHGNSGLFNGLVGSKPGHFLLKACIDNLTTSGTQNNLCLIMEETGPGYFAKIFLMMASSCELGKTVLLPPHIFYPLPAPPNHLPYPPEQWMDKEWLKQKFVKLESMGIHYHDRSWQ